MHRCIILIRCQSYTNRLGELVEQLRDIKPGEDWSYEIAVVPDRLHQEDVSELTEFDGLGVKVLPMNRGFLRSHRLHYYEEPERTGWACGDYVLYRALSEKWDYAWVIEPDVYFLNGALDVFARCEDLTHCLIATHLWPAAGNWMWRKQLQWFYPNDQIYAMAFPLLRASRTVVESGLSVRQSITEEMPKNARVPNDESIISSVAHWSGEGVLDLKSAAPDVFRYWSTAMRFPVRDIREASDSPLIVHSGLEPREFLAYLHELWNGVGEGWAKGRPKLLVAFRVASPQTKQTFFEHITMDRLNSAD